MAQVLKKKGPWLERAYVRLLRFFSKPQERGEYSGGYWQNKIRERAIALVPRQSLRLLEVGCGEGLFLEGVLLRNPSIEVWGIDVWDEILARAEERLQGRNVHLSQSHGQGLPFENNFFDCVVCVNVFLNLPSQEDVERMILEMARVCKPGGYVIAEFRNSLNPLIWLKFKLARLYDATVRQRNLPLRSFRESMMRQRFQNADLNIERAQYLDFPFKFLAPIIIVKARKS
ncbi:MAG: class I SAM-dependent methyltransferase [Candidatus Omnitrophica bacterium]|nr:class I SAM-dependent methyltransferase [Candidatus Omnitrophota bacterium]